MQATDLHFIRLTGPVQTQGRLEEFRGVVSIIYPLKFELFAGRKQEKEKMLKLRNRVRRRICYCSLQSKDFSLICFLNMKLTLRGRKT